MSDEMPFEGVVSAHADAEGVTIVRVFNAPREALFRAWTVGEDFAQWFGEHGSEIPLDQVSMDARPGGKWHATMFHGPDRVEIPFQGTFREVVEPERVVMELSDRPLEEAGAYEVLTAVFKDLGNGRTEMHFTQRGGNVSSDEYTRAMRGELIFFERLGGHLKARHDPPAGSGPRAQSGRSS
jgi:uncharacterized protein YndB with AHSA1/START domain